MTRKAARQQSPLTQAASYLERACAASKCRVCGCFHDALASLADSEHAELAAIAGRGRDRLTDRRYDCRGCKVCFPALAVNALERAGVETGGPRCEPGALDERDGWPPLPGRYEIVRYQAPVAVCALNSLELLGPLAGDRNLPVSIVGGLCTENLGVERIITNLLANPNVRFLVVCGADSTRAVGHLPGQSLVSLGERGVDEEGRIIGARGKRPVLRNVTREAVERFRRVVEIVNRVGVDDADAIRREIRACAARDPGPAEPFVERRAVRSLFGRIPGAMAADPAGYFVLFVDHARGALSLEHYANSGVLDAIITGRSAAELYTPAIEEGLVSRLDHAAYLGRELARAEAALAAGEDYVQDGAPEQRADSVEAVPCACAECCGEGPE